MRARVSDASMAAQARPPPGCVLRAVLRGAARPGPTAVEKGARTCPCLQSWEPVAQRRGEDAGPLGGQDGTRLSEVTAPAPVVPGQDVRSTRVPDVLEARTADLAVRFTGLSPASSPSGIWGRGRDGPAFLETLSDQE